MECTSCGPVSTRKDKPHTFFMHEMSTCPSCSSALEARVVLRDGASGTELTVWADGAYPYFQLFTGDPLPDVNRRSLAVEPMSCPANAFRSGEGVVRLEPGASWAGVWGIA